LQHEKSRLKKPQSPETKMGPMLSTQALICFPKDQKHFITSQTRQQSPAELKAFETAASFAKHPRKNGK
jgi:hypothetical protein